MYEKTKTGNEDENNKEKYLTQFMTEDNYYVTINLDSLKNKIIFNAYIQEIGNLFYSKEYSYEELSNYRILKNEKNLAKIYELISKSIYYYEVRTKMNDNNNLVLIINLIFDDGKSSNKQKTNFELNKIEPSKEEIINTLMDKVNFLICEKKNYLQGYKVK